MSNFDTRHWVAKSINVLKTIFKKKLRSKTKKITPKWRICLLVNGWLWREEEINLPGQNWLSHIGAPGCLVTNLVNNLVIHWILWSIWWQYWWHILWVTKFVTTFGDISFTHFGDPLKLSPDLVTYISQNVSLN